MESLVEECMELMDAISLDQPQNMRNVLTRAAQQNILRDLLEHRDSSGYTVIHFALSKNNPRALEIILAFALMYALLRNVLLSLDNNGFSILHFAVFMGNPTTVQMLLDYAEIVGVLDHLRNVLGPGNRDILYYAQLNPGVLQVLNSRGDGCRRAGGRRGWCARSPRGS